jgi:hypothetical protein
MTSASLAPRIARSNGYLHRNDSTAVASLRFAPWKNTLSGVELTLAAAAGAIRALVNNRVDKELIRPPVANRCRRSWWACEAVLLPVADHGAHSRSHQHAVVAVEYASDQRASRDASDLRAA